MRRIREQLELTQKEAAGIFGGGDVAFSKYECDDLIQAKAMDNLLKIAAAFPEAFGFLRHSSTAQKQVVESADWKNVHVPVITRFQRSQLHPRESNNLEKESSWQEEVDWRLQAA